jgi:drug/metabolite transporter (DMT)-like permease
VSPAHTWTAIGIVVAASTAGDILIAKAMRRVGDVTDVRRRAGLAALFKRIFTNLNLAAGIACMAVAFFSLLAALSWADVTLVAPAAASLTFVASALAAHVFLDERVDRRRWISALLVAGGVVLLAL